MMATIDGVTVMGTPEEIQRFRDITSKREVQVDNFGFIHKVDVKAVAGALNEMVKTSTRSRGIV